MRNNVLRALLGVFACGAAPASAQPQAWLAPGALCAVSVSIEGGAVPLYPARDGSGRYYLEARTGRGYEVVLANRSAERLGVVLSVDGLNAISGERDRSVARPGDPGRMYVLDPWETTRVRGWRTSLEDVHRFTFVDERASYAARSGKANARMGWIEVAVFRESRPWVPRRPAPVTNDPYPAEPPRPQARDGGRGEARAERARPADGAMPSSEAAAEAPAQAAQAPAAEAPAAAPADQARARAGFDDGDSAAAKEAPQPRAYPGTGWGQRERDPVVVVDFKPSPEPAERITLRYEYRPALQALGLLPADWPHGRDRLAERERGQAGFVTPPPR